MALPAVDAVVIGAGAGGGVVAKELATAGMKVVLLERGRWVTPFDCRKDDLRNQRTTILGNAFGPDDDGNPRVLVDDRGGERILKPSEGGYNNNAACVGGGNGHSGRFAAAGNIVVVKIDLLGEGIVAFVLGRENLLSDGRRRGGFDAVAYTGFEMNQKNIEAVVALNFVAEGFDVLDSHDVDAGASGEIVDGTEAFGSEVGCVVVHDLIVEYANVFAALARKIRKIENAYAASVVGHDVVIDVGVFGIFDFEAVHVELGAIAAENYIFGLADVEARISRAAGDGIFDRHPPGRNCFERRGLSGATRSPAIRRCACS